MDNFLFTLTGRVGTIRTYRSIFKHWIEGQVKPEWTEQDLKQYAFNLLSKGLAPRTIKTTLRLSRDYIQWSTGKVINIQPIIRQVMKTKQQEKVKALSKEEGVKFLKYCEALDKELYLPCSIGMYTGMRRGEVWGLTWEDVDLLKGEILVQRSYDGPTKTGLSRVIPINAALEQVLLAESLNIADNKTRVVPRKFDPNPRIKRICNLAKLSREITFHGLRHTFGTVALESGESLRKVADVLGHSSVQTTAEVYWNLMDKMDMEIFK